MVVTSRSTTRRAEAPAVPDEPTWRLTVEQYHQMIQTGILTEDDRIELLHGCLIAKMVKNPLHQAVARRVRRALERVIPAGWDVEKERPVTLVSRDSEPEPDIMVIRGDAGSHADRHPGPQDIALVIEIADSSQERDRGAKKRLYAAADVPVYWIVNLIDSRIEVHSIPPGATSDPEYHCREDFGTTDAFPLIIGDEGVAQLAVGELLR